MGMLKIFVAGALSYVGYKTWQRYQADARPTALEDDSARTPPHGDPLLTDASADGAAALPPSGQPRTGFGEA